MSSKINQLRMGILLSYLSKVIQIIIGLLYTPIMIRLLGQAEYGLYNIAASVIAYLGILNFGFGSAYMRFYSRYKIEEDKKKIANLNGMFLIVFSVLGLVAICAGMIIVLNIEKVFGLSLSRIEIDTTQKLMFILVVNLAITFPNIVFNTYIQANEKFIALNVIRIIRQITTPLVILPLLLAGYGSVGMVIGTTMINIVLEIITIVYVIIKMGMEFAFKEFDKHLMKEMTIYSSYIFLNMIVDQINNNMDKTILGRYQGTVSVAVYSVAASLKGYYQEISTTISAVFTPRIHKMVASNVDEFELTSLFTRVGRIQFALLSLIMTGFIFFGKPFIGIWAGEDYYSSYLIGLFLMIPLTIPLIQTIGIEVQRAKNMHQFRSWMYIFMAIANLIISIPLSIQFGGVGAAFGTAVSLVLGHGIAMNLYNHHKIQIDMLYFWKEIGKLVPALLIPAVYGVFINYFKNLYVFRNLVIFGLIYFGIYSLSMWCIGLNDYEKKIIKKPFK